MSVGELNMYPNSQLEGTVCMCVWDCAIVNRKNCYQWSRGCTTSKHSICQYPAPVGFLKLLKVTQLRTVNCSQVCLRRGECFFLKQRLKAVITGQATWTCLNWFWAKNWCFRRNAAKQVFQYYRTWESVQCWGPRLVCSLHGTWMCVASALLTHSPIKYVTVVKGRRIE